MPRPELPFTPAQKRMREAALECLERLAQAAHMTYDGLVAAVVISTDLKVDTVKKVIMTMHQRGFIFKSRKGGVQAPVYITDLGAWWLEEEREATARA